MHVLGASSSALGRGIQQQSPARPLAAAISNPSPSLKMSGRRAAAGFLASSLSLLRSSSSSSARSIMVSASSQSEPQAAKTWTFRAFPPIDFISADDAAELSNKIQLSGIIGSDLANAETKFGTVGRMVLYVKPKPMDRSYSEKYTIELYSGLAEEAAHKLAKGSNVHVEGRLRCESYVDKKTGAQRMNLVVEVRRMYLCTPRSEEPPEDLPEEEEGDEGGDAESPPPPQQQQQYHAPPAAAVKAPPPVPAPTPQPKPRAAKAPAAAAAAPAAAPAARAPFTKITLEREKELWEELRQSQAAFWDNRVKKLNPKAPDFKHKQTGEGLWLSSPHNPGFT